MWLSKASLVVVSVADKEFEIPIALFDSRQVLQSQEPLYVDLPLNILMVPCIPLYSWTFVDVLDIVYPFIDFASFGYQYESTICKTLPLKSTFARTVFNAFAPSWFFCSKCS